MAFHPNKLKTIGLLVVFVLVARSTFSQQFNSDGYITMPHGIGTIIFTTGERNSTLYTSFAILPRLEVALSTNLYNPTDSLKMYRHL